MKKAIVIFDIIWGLILVFFLLGTFIIGISEHDAYYISMAVLLYLMFIRHLNTLNDDLNGMRESELSKLKDGR